MKKLLISLVLVCLLFAGFTFLKNRVDESQNANKSNGSQNDIDKSRYPIDEPSSLWVVVNKKRPLPNTFVPKNLVDAGNGELLRQDAKAALSKLVSAAAKNGVELKIVSAYRSFEAQTNIYSGYVAQDGQAADAYSARAGHSEHQTGLGVDLGNSSGECDLDACFGDTSGGKWLAANAHKYGFIIRYQKGKENITGYQAEPWHLRYVGNGLATQLKATNQTMEEFFGLPAAPNY
jgi:D-alanyl-D-alanine carboxypeptidase